MSRDLADVQFKDLKTLAASVVAGKELASLVSPAGVLPRMHYFKGMISSADRQRCGQTYRHDRRSKRHDREWRPVSH